MKPISMPVSLLIATAVAALLGIATYIALHKEPRPAEMQLFSIEKLAPEAKRRDPFACGQGLKLFIDNSKETEMRSDFIRWCCLPPIEDMSGYIKQSCAELLKTDPGTPETL